MKFLSAIFLTCLFSILIATSCKKETTTEEAPTVARTVQFALYTDKDFSTDNHSITFRLFIQNSASQTIWDTVLAPMQIKGIPAEINKIVVEKTVSYNTSLLKVGFDYDIENVGNSWYLDSFSAGQT